MSFKNIRLFAVLLAICLFFTGNGPVDAATRVEITGCDMDGNSVDDQVIVKRGGATVVLKNSNGGTKGRRKVNFQREYSLGEGGWTPTCEDAKGDDKLEIVLTRGSKRKVFSVFGSGNGNIAACTSFSSFPGSFIYKTIGSNHFSDCRRNTVGLIMKPGAGVATPSCINIYSTDGTRLGAVGLYARGAGWHARYYSCIGCGSPAQNGSTLARKARDNGGSNTVFFELNGRCYELPDASRCVGSSQC